MNRFLVTASMTAAIAEGAPDEIVYLPEGIHTITPSVGGVPKKITVKVPADKGEKITEALNQSLDERKKSNVRPWFDFMHKAEASSAFPQSFRYEPGVGVMCSVEWTGSGRAAVQGRDFSYLSPSFHIDDDGYPYAVANRGPLAALVNEPAFREIPRIAAADQTPAAPNIQTTNEMKLILSALAIDPEAEGAEKLAADKITVMKDAEKKKADRIAELEAELAALKGEKETAEKDAETAKAECSALKKAKLSGLVESAVMAGKIAAKDETAKAEALELLEANEALGVKFLAALPVKFDKLDEPLTKPGSAKVDAADKFAGKSGLQLLEAALADEIQKAN